MERLNDKAVVADSDLRADMERWHKNKHKDMKELFIEMADRNLHYYQKVSSTMYYSTAVLTSLLQF